MASQSKGAPLGKTSIGVAMSSKVSLTRLLCL